MIFISQGDFNVDTEETMKPTAHLSKGDVIEHDGRMMEFNNHFQGNLMFVVDDHDNELAFLDEELPEQVVVLFNSQ